LYPTIRQHGAGPPGAQAVAEGQVEHQFRLPGEGRQGAAVAEDQAAVLVGRGQPRAQYVEACLLS